MDDVKETTQVDEQPKDEQVSLEGVEIVSNGEIIDTSTPEEQPKEVETEDKQKEEDTKHQAEQTEFDQAKTEMVQAKTELSSKGIDYAKLEAEYNSKGELSEESYKQLEEAGYPKTLVSAVITGWQAKADAFANKIIDNAGGKREYQRITKFVSEQGKSAVDAFNEIVEKSDLNVVNAYITGIKAQMVAKYGTNNPTLAGSSSAPAGKGYEDANEMVKAMSDPRYGKDAKYTKSVEEMVAKSTFF